MPLLHEMPAGQRGIDLTSRAVYIVVMGIAMAVYGVMGIFASARYGLQTQGNVLVNQWLGGAAEGVLDAVMMVYLSISIPPMQVRQHHPTQHHRLVIYFWPRCSWRC